MKLKIEETRGLFVPRSLLQKDDMEKIGKEAVSLITERVTKEGRGIDDLRMPDYTKQYKRRKKLEGGRVDKRDLVLTGKFMLGLRYYNVSHHKVTVGFQSSYGQTLARAHNKRHAFLGLSKKDWVYMRVLVRSVVMNRLRKLVYTRPK
jgi:hypothetical protein